MTKYILKKDKQLQDEDEFIIYFLIDGDEDDNEQQEIKNKKAKLNYMKAVAMLMLSVVYEEEGFEYE